MNEPTTLVWFRHDLRLADNPALNAAIESGNAIVPVFIFACEAEGNWPPGAASRWWLHHSLHSLQRDLEQLGSRLIIRQGESFQQLELLLKETGADSVHWNRRYEPAIVERDQDIKAILNNRGIKVESHNASLLFEPWQIETQNGTPYRVFTPFWKSCLAADRINKPIKKPDKLEVPRDWPETLDIAELGLEPDINWAEGFSDYWQPGETGARTKLNQFLDSSISSYKDDRNRPDLPGTSRLSPHLHFGEISPHQIWHAVLDTRATNLKSKKRNSPETFLSEIGWREFAHHILYYHRDTPDQPLRDHFAEFPWKKSKEHLQAWQKGQTGYPIVDAGMRELWQTGWMHNRVRMIVGSFLTKDLMINWLEGAKWFWDTLVDADLANNTLGWQWVAGCGADAAPYFRIFNPITQGETFDPDGEYVRRWVPELKDLSNRWIHQPWNAPVEELEDANIEPGNTYPKPIVDHQQARKEALEALDTIKN